MSRPSASVRRGISFHRPQRRPGEAYFSIVGFPGVFRMCLEGTVKSADITAFIIEQRGFHRILRN